MHHREVKVEEIMSTALMTANADETVENVEFEMKMADVRHIPVVGPRNRLIGIVSQRDLLRALAGPKTRGLPIAEIMTRRVQTVEATDPALRAVDLLLDNKIGCVPVLGEDGQLVGIVTETDFLRIARDSLVAS